MISHFVIVAAINIKVSDQRRILTRVNMPLLINSLTLDLRINCISSRFGKSYTMEEAKEEARIEPVSQ